MLEAKLDADIKQALLGGDKFRAEVLRGLKSAMLYEKVAKNLREQGLSDEQFLAIVIREVKKRAESADLYAKAAAQDRADKELSEKAILEEYLPKQLSDDELTAIVDEVISSLDENVQMGQIIGAVRAKVGARSDGKRIADAVKNKVGS
jgi:uncharacterized protein YqeY